MFVTAGINIFHVSNISLTSFEFHSYVTMSCLFKNTQFKSKVCHYAKYCVKTGKMVKLYSLVILCNTKSSALAMKYATLRFSTQFTLSIHTILLIAVASYATLFTFACKQRCVPVFARDSRCLSSVGFGPFEIQAWFFEIRYKCQLENRFNFLTLMQQLN